VHRRCARSQPQQSLVGWESDQGNGYLPLDALAEEDHGAARSPQGLVRRGGDKVGVLKRGGHHIGRNEARNVRHVRKQVRSNAVADGAHPLVVDVAGIRGSAGNDDLGAEEEGVLRQTIVVDEAGGLIEAVRHLLEEDGGGADLLLGGRETV
jgi:hypothetical protein